MIVQNLFWIAFFVIFWANIGYPISIILIDKILKKQNYKNYEHQPTTTVMVVAHNEEDVILKKLKNLLKIDYPMDKIQILIASDNSTDRTNEIVEKFIKENSNLNIRLHRAKKRMGKTNAQNEAQKLVETEYLVMTDANAMLEKNSIKELMASFISDDIAYVAGKLVYTNEDVSDVSDSESTYWTMDLRIREIESSLQTITAGNGALYACRNSEYVDFEPIKSHDSSMPIYYALKGKRAITNHSAIAYEKAGENLEDEFKRKVRMNRVLLRHILPSVKILNVFKFKWFTYFYLGHRTSRYLLWLSHTVIFIMNAILAMDTNFYTLVFIPHVMFWIIAFMKQEGLLNNKFSKFIHYYAATIIAQWKGVLNTILGQSKPFWEKAESTR